VAALHVPVGAERILLMATHTHLGPSHYFGVTNYVGPFSSRLTGFDPHLLAFLADRIARAIQQAYAHARPARLGWSQGPVTEPLTRNRDPHPFLQNDYAPAWLASRIASNPAHPEEGAVDPTLSVLRIDQLEEHGARYLPQGVFAVLGMHPTAVSNTSDLYSADVFGYATRELQGRVKAEDAAALPNFVAGIANGIEGDVMPARSVTGLREARRFGHRMAEQIMARWRALGLHTDQFTNNAVVRVAYRELLLPGARTASGAVLCERPELGTPAGGGANDHPTLLRLFPQYNPGATSNQTHTCGHPKLPILMPFGEARAGSAFPGVAPISLVQIGTHLLVALPAEVTTMTGIRIREAVADELALPMVPSDAASEPSLNVGRSVVVVGLTNEYLQYVATPEEYALQYYEGASTLYGPNTARFLRDHAVCLARWLGNDKADACRLEQAKVNVLRSIHRPKLTDAELMSGTPGPAAAPHALGVASLDTTRDALLSVSVKFVGPAPDEVRSHEDLWVEVREANGSAEVLMDDDRGSTVSTEWQPYSQDARGWTARWIPDLPRSRAACGRWFFFIVGNQHGKQRSAPFQLDCSRLSTLSEVWP